MSKGIGKRNSWDSDRSAGGERGGSEPVPGNPEPPSSGSTPGSPGSAGTIRTFPSPCRTRSPQATRGTLSLAAGGHPQDGVVPAVRIGHLFRGLRIVLPGPVDEEAILILPGFQFQDGPPFVMRPLPEPDPFGRPVGEVPRDDHFVRPFGPGDKGDFTGRVQGRLAPLGLRRFHATLPRFL